MHHTFTFATSILIDLLFCPRIRWARDVRASYLSQVAQSASGALFHARVS